jgi:hypothetical protein
MKSISDDSRPKPPRAQRRRANRRAFFGQRVAEAPTPGRRMAGALSYVQALVQGLPHPMAERIAAEICDYLFARAEDIEAELAGEEL